MSHAWTGLFPADGSLLTIGWKQDWTHTANAATVTSRETASDLSAWLIAREESCTGKAIIKEPHSDISEYDSHSSF